MNKVSEILIDYCKNRNIEVFSITDVDSANKMFDTVRNITNWLNFEHKKSNWLKSERPVTHKPMIIQDDYLELTVKLISQCKIMNDYFEITDNKLDFKNSINEEERKMIREDLYNYYLSTRHSLIRDNGIN